MKTCFWDIETTHLKSNFGIILCAGIKPLEEKPIMLSKGRHGSDDRELVTKIAETLEKYDVLVSYYGLNFDLKFLNSRLMKWGQEPLRPTIYHIDMYRAVRKVINTHSRRLATVTQFLGIEGKDSVEPDLWQQAALDGDKKALEYIIEHCRKDVIVLEELYKKPGMKQFITVTKNH